MRNLYQQILEKIRSQKKPAFLAGSDAIIPAYHGMSIANIPASICRWLDCSLEGKSAFSPELMKEFDDAYDRVILILVDGLNLSLFDQFLKDVQAGRQQKEWNSIFSDGRYFPLTSVVPSTTSAALTTLWTSAQPAEHGIIGYELFLKEFGCITNMLTHAPASFSNSQANISSAGFDPASFLPVPPLGPHLRAGGVRAHTFQHDSIINSGLSRMILTGVETHAYQDGDSLWASAREVLARGRREKQYLYIYWSELDTCSHLTSPDHSRMRDEWNIFSRGLYQFISALPGIAHGKTLLLLTADHGQISTQYHTDYEMKNHPELGNHLIMKPSGESRLPFIFIKNGHETEVARYLASHWDQQFKIFPSSDFLRSGMLGTAAPYHGTIDRVGTHVVVPEKNAYWWWVDKDNVLKGRHGGLSPQEMLVPFLAVSI